MNKEQKLKQCSKCKQKLPINDYHKDKSKKDGLREQCKSCRCVHPSGDLLKECKACNEKFLIKENGNKGQLYCGIVCQRYFIKYNINKHEYNELIKKCNNRCTICKQKETNTDSKTNKKYSLSVDHCHKTGNVRGLLCSSCNNGLGFFKDNIELLNNAINYLTDE